MAGGDHGAPLGLMLLLLGAGVAAGQHSDPVAHNQQLTKGDNKFRTREIGAIESHVFGTDASKFDPVTACPHRVYQHWATEVEASVYSTPVIFDVASDGVKDIVVPTFVRHVEVLDGPHGLHAPGFPFSFPNSAFYASPIIYDINKDGEPDIGMTTFNGELVWLNENGMPILGKSIRIPHLRVRKGWYEGLKPDPQDMEHTGKTQFEEAGFGGTGEPGRDPVSKPQNHMYDWDDIRRKKTDQPDPYAYHHEPEPEPEDEAKSTMKAADKDEDGKLTKDEYKEHMKSTNTYMSDEELDAVAKRIDKDKDGSLSLQELTDNYEREQERQYGYARWGRDFKQADKDTNGKLSRHEFRLSALKDNPELTDKAVDALFKEADKNGDGVLSKREARMHWDSFDPMENSVPKKDSGVDRESVVDKALKELMRKNPALKPPRAGDVPTKEDTPPEDPNAPKRKLLQDHQGPEVPISDDIGSEFPDGGSEASSDGGVFQNQPELDEATGDQGENSVPAPDIPEALGPRDGEELVDGEDYYDHHHDPYYDPYSDDEDDWGRYYDRRGRYAGYETEEQRLARVATENAAKKRRTWESASLNQPQTAWTTMKAYYAPENLEQTDAEVQKGMGIGGYGTFGMPNMRQAILGADEVFTRLMSVDRRMVLEKLVGRNQTLPLPGDRPKEEGYVYVDAHVLCTPIVADLDADGHDEIVFAVSYYFDRDQYSDPAAYEDLDVDIKINKYVAGGVAVYDLETRKLKWHTHLDLTTDETMYRAYIYSSPSVADLDADGKLEIVLATSLGFIYVLNADGKVREGFPVTMAEIQGQVGIADINDDGLLELVASDNRNNVAAFSAKGKELWERHISGFSAQGPTIGDINGDGIVDVVLGTSNGAIWALNGKNGDTLRNFPVKVGGGVNSPPLILQMKGGGTGSAGLPVRHVVVPAHDGFLHIIDGLTGCTFKYDIGENSYSMVVADDVTGNGMMDLIVSTMNGNVLCLGTDVEYHPMKAWGSRELGNNNVELRDGRQGIYVLEQYRSHHDNTGATMMLGFEIVDNRPVKGFGRGTGTYTVKISVGGNAVLFQKTYTAPGKYLEEVPCPARRQYSTVYVQMRNELGQYFDDRVAMSFNMRFYRALKWILVIPFCAMAGVVVLVKDMQHMLPM